MLKVKDKLVQKIYRTDLSNFEQLVLFAFLKEADESGKVDGIYYKEIVEEVGCSIAQFYNILESLEQKDFIIYEKSQTAKKEWKIQILDNNFCQERVNNFTNYTNLAVAMWDDEKWNTLKAGARRLLLYLVFRVMKQKYATDDKKQNKNRLFYSGKINKYSTIAKEIGITVRGCRDYMDSLRKAGFISIGNNIDVNARNYDIITVATSILQTQEITCTEKGTLRNRKSHALHECYCHVVNTICRRSKIKKDKQHIEDTALLIMQYKRIADQQQKDIFQIMKNAINQLQEKILDSRIVHSIVKKIINKNYKESIILYQ